MPLPRPGSAGWSEAHAEGAASFALRVSELLDAAEIPPAPVTSATAIAAVETRLAAMRATQHPDGIVPLDPGAWSP